MKTTVIAAMLLLALSANAGSKTSSCIVELFTSGQIETLYLNNSVSSSVSLKYKVRLINDEVSPTFVVINDPNNNFLISFRADTEGLNIPSMRIHDKENNVLSIRANCVDKK